MFRFTVCIFLLAPLCVRAAESDINAIIRQAIESHYPGQQVLDIARGPIPGLREVYTNRGLFYVDDSARLLFSGAVMEINTGRNLTLERQDEHGTIDFAALPLARAIRIVNGNGRGRLAVFADPDCPYCQQLERELASLQDVTIYTFLYPLPIHPQAPVKARAIWCAKDRAKAWRDWMLSKSDPGHNTCEGDPIDETLALGKRLAVTGTPTLFFSDGRRLTGGAPAMRLAQLLEKAASAPGR